MPAPVEFEGDQTSVLSRWPSQVLNVLFASEIVCGERIIVESGMPCLIAAASTNTLNVDPAWKPLASPYSAGTT